MGIKSNIKKLNDLIKEAKSHCMCLDFSETSNHFIIIYPDGYYPNGLRVEKGSNKSKALKTVIEYMEKHWQESFPGYPGFN